MERYEVTINRIAQGEIPIEEGIEWFKALPEEEQHKALRGMNLCIHQSHPRELEIEEGIKLSGLKETYTPCVIMRKNTFNSARAKVLALPSHEWLKAFRLWLAIFTIADSRRRSTDCQAGCDHWWHNLEML
ncbi:DUF5958 family protein [Microbulbifer variabilis]|uniref:DUF5958 family protein n=1 Tax=Microbulbifer variabilis TaxID=266805 RepID=UPI000375A199|nr:DUF5958 family protein [Microbulbifer variabilis]